VSLALKTTTQNIIVGKLSAFAGLDHGVGHFRPLSLTRQRACWHIMTLQ